MPAESLSSPGTAFSLEVNPRLPAELGRLEEDQMIAAHARSADVPLVTSNARHFARTPKLAILDWAR